MSKPVMIIKPQSISPKDKEKLSKNGYLVIEHPFPGDVKIINDFSLIQTDDLLMTALEALNWGNDATCRHAFGDLFRERLIKKIKDSKLTTTHT
jgi:hypothetical protein